MNDEWRICFVGREAGPAGVEIADYPCGQQLPNPTPGEISVEDLLRPLGLSQIALAQAVRVPPPRTNETVLGKRCHGGHRPAPDPFFRLNPGFFLGLQANHALMARRREIGPDLEAIKPRAA